MSAYVVDREHIIYLVRAAQALSITRYGMSWYHDGQHHELKGGDLTEEIRVANMLWQENITSVRYRYPDDTFDTMPGPIGETYVMDERDLTFFWDAFNPIQVIKSCNCYEYQACEHPGWETSEAHCFIDSLKEHAMRSLPGYDDAEWGAPPPNP